MYPHERSLVKKLESKPFALIGVNSDRDREALKPTLAKEQITWRSFWNGAGGTQGPISSAWSVNGWPTLYLIDAKGVIRRQWVGSPPAAQLDSEIDALLKEVEGKKT
jgi:Thioredoxin-like